MEMPRRYSGRLKKLLRVSIARVALDCDGKEKRNGSVYEPSAHCGG